MIKIIFTKADGKKYAVSPFNIVELTEADNSSQTWALMRVSDSENNGLKTVLLEHNIKDIVDTIQKFTHDF